MSGNYMLVHFVIYVCVTEKTFYYCLCGQGLPQNSLTIVIWLLFEGLLQKMLGHEKAE